MSEQGHLTQPEQGVSEKASGRKCLGLALKNEKSGKVEGITSRGSSRSQAQELQKDLVHGDLPGVWYSLHSAVYPCHGSRLLRVSQALLKIGDDEGIFPCNNTVTGFGIILFFRSIYLVPTPRPPQTQMHSVNVSQVILLYRMQLLILSLDFSSPPLYTRPPLFSVLPCLRISLDFFCQAIDKSFLSSNLCLPSLPSTYREFIFPNKDKLFLWKAFWSQLLKSNFPLCYNYTMLSSLQGSLDLLSASTGIILNSITSHLLLT